MSTITAGSNVQNLLDLLQSMDARIRAQQQQINKLVHQNSVTQHNRHHHVGGGDARRRAMLRQFELDDDDQEEDDEQQVRI